MTIKRPDSFEEFQRKQEAKRPALPPASHNTPDLPSLSHDELVYAEAARSAWLSLKKTFEHWITIARFLKVLEDKAERIGGRFTFDRLREREGLGGKTDHGGQVLNKTRVSRLRAIVENLPRVEEWRAKLTEKQRFNWASPEAVFQHCPVFAKPKPDGDGPKPLTKAEQDRLALAAVIEENKKLKERLAASDGDRFKPTDTAEDIATVIVGMFSPTKAEEIFKRGLAKLKGSKGAKPKARAEGAALVWEDKGPSGWGDDSRDYAAADGAGVFGVKGFALLGQTTKGAAGYAAIYSEPKKGVLHIGEGRTAEKAKALVEKRRMQTPTVAKELEQQYQRQLETAEQTRENLRRNLKTKPGA